MSNFKFSLQSLFVPFLSMYFYLYLLSNAHIVNRQVQNYRNCERKTKKHEMHCWLISSRELAWGKWLKSMTEVHRRLKVSMGSWGRSLGGLCRCYSSEPFRGCGGQLDSFQMEGQVWSSSRDSILIWLNMDVKRGESHFLNLHPVLRSAATNTS